MNVVEEQQIGEDFVPVPRATVTASSSFCPKLPYSRAYADVALVLVADLRVLLDLGELVVDERGEV